MWTKNKSLSLYLTAPLRVLRALLISAGLFLVFALLADTILLHLFGVNVNEQKQETEELVQEIQLRINENSLTFQEALAVESQWSHFGYTLHFLNSTSQFPLASDAGVVEDTYFIYEIQFADLEGSVLIISNAIRTRYIAYFAVALLVSAALFLTLVFQEISRIIGEIKTIEQGITKIAKEDLRHKIEIQGEKEFISLAQNINKMGQTLYTKNKQEREEEANKRTFITNLSHDIRTPLTSISGYIELILAKSEDDEISSYAKTAQKNSLRLQKLIDDLFLYSKLISEDVEIRPEMYRVGPLLFQMVELREGDYDVQIVQTDTTILADLQNFQRAISNLLDNAEKYKSEHSKIVIQNYNSGNNTIIEIQNETDEDLSKKIHLLTNRLYKAEENRKDSSSGLGLSIVTELLKTFDAALLLSFENRVFTAKITIPIQK